MSTAPSVSLIWNEGTMGEWGRHFASVPRSTLPQCFGYAHAMAKTRGYVPRLGLIHHDGQPIGLVQVLERRFVEVFRQAQIHRGPLWFGTMPELDVVEAVLRALRRNCPDAPWRRLSFLPELPASPEMAALMTRCGFKQVSPGYRTVWLDLSTSPEAMRARFAGSWRKGLRAAEKAGLVLDVDPDAKNLPWLLKQDERQAETKHYKAAPGDLITRLRGALRPANSVLMVTALGNREPAAAALLFIHGHTATYQIGWSNELGRRTNAMRLVLWRAIDELKRRAVTALDLGGINPDDAPGVSEFKLGLGGEVFESVGLFR